MREIEILAGSITKVYSLAVSSNYINVYKHYLQPMACETLSH